MNQARRGLINGMVSRRHDEQIVPYPCSSASIAPEITADPELPQAYLGFRPWPGSLPSCD